MFKRIFLFRIRRIKWKMKNKLFILLLAFVLLLSACSNNSPPDDNTKEVLPELESAGSIEKIFQLVLKKEKYMD